MSTYSMQEESIIIVNPSKNQILGKNMLTKYPSYLSLDRKHGIVCHKFLHSQSRIVKDPP